MRNTPPWWDPYSCQPYKLADENKPRNSVENVWEYLKTALALVIGLPAIVLSYLLLRSKPATHIAPHEFVGLSVDLGFGYATEQLELIKELGVRSVLLRIPSWDVDNLSLYTDFIKQLIEQNGDVDITVNILQSRDSTQDVAAWREAIARIVSATAPSVTTFWIGNAFNRTKWGCRHFGEALELQEVIPSLKANYPEHRFLGSSVIDFEPLLTWRSLFNAFKFRLDGVATLMYVNRRHSPFNTQYGIFDLNNKLRLTKAMTRISPKTKNSVWVTETNWPLLNTKPYTPNSGNPTRTVDEDTQAKYLTWYYQIAYQSGWIDRVYWWSLINPGYGLIDHREGSLRKMPSFYAFKRLLDGELQQPLKQ